MNNDPARGGSVQSSDRDPSRISEAGSACGVFTERSVMEADVMIRAADGKVSLP